MGHDECREIWAVHKTIVHRLAVPGSPLGDIANAEGTLIYLAFGFLDENK